MTIFTSHRSEVVAIAGAKVSVGHYATESLLAAGFKVVLLLDKVRSY
jgi:NADP-dependent 3-hydroxy acid dehydrogenase YdfG